MSDIESLTRSALAEIKAAANLDVLETLRVALLGKSGSITSQLKQLGGLPPDLRKSFGEKINRVKDAISEKIAERKSALEEAAFNERLANEHFDVSLPGRGNGIGNLHPVTRALER